jgi:subtilisin-like proprotein convertase family protein
MRLHSIAKLLTVVFTFSVLVSASLGQTTFPGSNFGAIADGTTNCSAGTGNGAPRDIAFAVSGITGAVSAVEVSVTFGTPIHTFVGDLTATLIAPDTVTSKVLFGCTGSTTATGFGDSSDLAGPYVFKDTAAAPPSGGWWQEATVQAATAALSSGSYRSTDKGGAGAVNPQPPTTINTAFTGVANANGTWILRVVDGGAGDTGGITAASLTLTPSVPVDAPNDINGDGKSDFVIVRADASSSFAGMGVNDETGKDKVANAEKRAENKAPQAGVGWWSILNNGSSPSRVTLGVDTDFFQMGDFDGDGKDDFCVWSPGAAGVAAFKILKSSTNTVSVRLYGQTGDTPDVIGDWNADGKDDLAVYRDGTAGSPQSFFFWSNETTPTAVNYIPWGTDGDVGYALDYDGDGKLDPAVQRNGGGGRGDHYIRNSSTGALSYVIYGLSSDFVVPGDYDGDGKDDIVVSRNANFGGGTFKYFWIRETDGGGTPNSPLQWGISGDFICQGDYDGDGKTDVGVWRSNADPNLNFFFGRRSSDGSLLQLEWGASGDYPVNNWNVH